MDENPYRAPQTVAGLPTPRPIRRNTHRALFIVFSILTVAALAVPNLATWIKIACGVVALYSGIQWWREARHVAESR